MSAAAHARAAWLVMAVALSATPAMAQSLGTLRWQLQPFCNVVTVNVTRQGDVYTVDGQDDQCGAPQRAPLVGMAVLNPDGSVGLGLHVVTVPGGRGLQIDARISVASGSGPWTDSAGNSGTFVLGGNAGGSPRPAPTLPGSAIAPGSITTAQLAAGAVTAAQLAPGVIGAVAQARVTGICANGQALRGVNPDGSVACTTALTTVHQPLSSRAQWLAVAIGADGLPVISHQSEFGYTLLVTHCGNAACTAGNVTTTVAGPTPRVGGYTAVAIGTDGLPVISYYDADAGALRVLHCGNPACTAGNVSTVADDITDPVGIDTAIAIGVDGLPVISHQQSNSGGNGLRVTHCANVACTGASVSTLVDDPVNSVGFDSAIAIGADGLPVISHFDTTAGALRVSHCGNAACTAGNTSVTAVAATFAGGRASSIGIGTDGLPVVTHQDAAGNVLRVTHCGTATCSSGNVSTTVDATASRVGLLASLAIGADGLPIVSHHDVAGSLRVTHCGNGACTAGNVTAVVDDPENIVGFFIDLAIGADGLPVIAYGDYSAGSVKVAKCGTRTCQ